MSQKLELRLNFDEDLNTYLKKHHKEIIDFKILTKSLDSRGAPRGKKPLYYYVLEVIKKGESFQAQTESFGKRSLPSTPLIIGAGPAGLFAALRFQEYGIKTIIVERGEEANKRMLHISRYWKKGVLNTESNVCYGEGGAGLYSDGKLITRVKSPFIKYVMRKLVDFGAPEETAYTSNPHLGSNKIRVIITKISDMLKSHGHKFIYKTRVDGLLYQGKKVIGAKLSNGEEIHSDYVILATGHSAKEMYYHLDENHVEMKSKDFAVGVRIEHPRRKLDSLQHGKYSEELEAARYKLSYHDKQSEKGTYSFCMCPGGYVLSSGTDEKSIVVNGMSNFARNSPWSNSALVVSVQSGRDFGTGVFEGLKFQEAIEQAAYELSTKHATGKELPAMTVGEFIQGALNDKELPTSSTPSKIVKADFTAIFPKFVIEHLRKGLQEFNKNIEGFLDEDALLIAPETRTSAPITIIRDKTTLESASHQGLYPCGEGAGYAGGITSAAVDGIRVVESILSDVSKV